MIVKSFKYIFVAIGLVMPCLSFGQKDDIFIKEWSDSNKLKISDFGGYPPPYRSEIIYPFQSIGHYVISPGPPIWTEQVVVELYKSWSWIKPNDTAEAIAQLQYTQDMFDLVEVYARMIRRAFQIRTFSSESFGSESEKIENEYEKKMYDDFVGIEKREHDSGTKKFSDLEQNIKIQLDSLKAYKNPIFKVIVH